MKKELTAVNMVCTIVCMLLSNLAYCEPKQEPEQDVDSIRIAIRNAEDEIKRLEKSNPSVYYAEKDTNINIKRKIRGAAINRKFMCPFHKGFTWVGGHSWMLGESLGR